MINLIDILFFLPSLVCAIWTVAFLVTKKSQRQKVANVCAAIGMLYFVSYALFTMPDTDYYLMSVTESFNIPLAMFLLSGMTIYMNLLITGENLKPGYLLSVIPAVIMASSFITIYIIIGYDTFSDILRINDSGLDLPKQYHTRLFDVSLFVDTKMVMIVALLYYAALSTQSVLLMRKTGFNLSKILHYDHRSKDTDPTYIINIGVVFLLILLLPVSINHSYIMQHQFLGILLAIGIAIALHFIFFAEFYNGIRVVSDEHLRKAELYDAIMRQKEEDDKIAAEAAEKKRLEEQALAENRKTLKERRSQSLIQALRTLLEEDQAFLDPNISIQDISEKLEIGRTNLSALISTEYNMNFRGIINKYRITYAMKYMIDNPRATQESVALASGFKDASSYSHKFKEITGKTPLSWLSENMNN